MRDQAVVLKPKQLVVELNALRSVTYSEPETGTPSGRMPTEHSLLSVGLGVQVGISDGFSAYANLPFERTIEAAGHPGAGKRTARTQPGSVTLGLQATLLTESAELPMVSLNAHGQLATKRNGRNGLGLALNVSRSVDPAILFGSLTYEHLFEGRSKDQPVRTANPDSVTGEEASPVSDPVREGPSTSASARAINTIGVTGGVALAVNDKVSVSGSLLSDGDHADAHDAAKTGITQAPCGAHTRRGFFEAQAAEPEAAAETLALIGERYQVYQRGVSAAHDSAQEGTATGRSCFCFCGGFLNGRSIGTGPAE